MIELFARNPQRVATTMTIEYLSAPSTRLLYRRQFLMGPAPLMPYEGWNVSRLAGQYISTHPDLEVNTITKEGKDIVSIGHLIDPNEPALDNRGVLEKLVKNMVSFEDSEFQTASLGGRWVLFISIEGEARIYPDAAGQKSVFYTKLRDTAQIWVGSQPRLLSEILRIPVDRALVDEFVSQKFQNSWPGEITPYPNILQLLPNHFLDVKTARAHRFWPKGPLDAVDIRCAATRISSILHNSITSASRRRSLVAPLTGGYDSRVIFTCACDIRKSIDFFTIRNPGVEHFDISIPRKLARRMSAKYKVLKTLPASNEFMKLQKINTSFMLSDPADGMAFSLSQIPDGAFVLNGSIAEVARCFYADPESRLEQVDGQYLARVSGFDGNTIAIRSFDDWLYKAPRNLGPNILDLFYWEHRLGNWSAMVSAARDMTCDFLPPFNCRELLETALGVAREYRLPPHKLFLKIYELTAPEVRSIPINTSFLHTTLTGLARIVPWRIQTWVRTQRMRRVGLHRMQTDGNAIRELLRLSPCAGEPTPYQENSQATLISG